MDGEDYWFRDSYKIKIKVKLSFNIYLQSNILILWLFQSYSVTKPCECGVDEFQDSQESYEVDRNAGHEGDRGNSTITRSMDDVLLTSATKLK